ncbi:MAG: glycosyltransferase [Planctomycetes bacterium]|nr:glycosyltransferase [Planctomycetota bacterium]
MKVCFVTSNFPPEAVGGTEQVVAALAARLHAAGVEVTAISGSDVPHGSVEAGHEDVRHERHEDTVVHRIFKLPDEWDRHGFVRPRILALVRDLLVREQPDLVHVHSTASLGSGVTTIAHELGLPVVMTFHDLWITCARYFRLPHGGVTCPTGTDRAACVVCVNDALQTDPAFVGQALAERDRVLREEVAKVSICTAPSATAARFVRECLPYGGDIEVIPHGLLRPVAAADRAPAPVPGERLRIGTFGGLVPEKGVLELVEAVAGLDVELWLVGRLHDATFRRLLHERFESQGTRHHVRTGGYGPGDRHPARDLHLAVFPSKCQETYGLVVDEALAHGVPAVLSDSGAFAERRGAPGIVVTPLPGLAATLQQLVASPERLAALRAAIPADLPTIDASARRHLELYRSLA